MVVERMAVELLQSARNVKELIVVNGHTPGIITKAVGGEARRNDHPGMKG